MGNYFSLYSTQTYKKYGWKPDLPDHRDQKLCFAEKHIPETVDLRSKCPPIYDQGVQYVKYQKIHDTAQFFYLKIFFLGFLIVCS